MHKDQEFIYCYRNAASSQSAKKFLVLCAFVHVCITQDTPRWPPVVHAERNGKHSEDTRTA